MTVKGDPKPRALGYLKAQLDLRGIRLKSWQLIVPKIPGETDQQHRTNKEEKRKELIHILMKRDKTMK